ncbi:MAG: hypothetical protein HYU66_03195 [Armatimonadetes bacterium]|nr:hypothetical protein [Armatimonadota bacterium]
MRRRLGWALAVLMVAGCAEGGDVMLHSDFEAGSAGWASQGQADFGLDQQTTHGGKQALRITVAAGAELRWQQWHRGFGPVHPGDEFSVGVWVRTRGVTDGSAYIALEYLDAGGARTNIDHGKVSPDNGRNDWEHLTIAGRAGPSTAKARLCLVLNAHGTAWFDDVEVQRTLEFAPWPDRGGAERRITVHPDQVTQPHFAGVGFHCFEHTFHIPQEMMDTVVAKRWRELNPSFARLNDSNAWDAAMLEQVAGHLLRLKSTGTEVYMATWGPEDTANDDERRAYARKVVDRLEWFERTRGADNLRWFCLTNELSLKSWGSLAGDLPKFKAYHQALYDELRARKLPIGLLATDASPISYWHTLEWAAQNMDDITAVYGGHHYFNESPPGDERFYPWFAERLEWAVKLARGKGKEFILGEFGCRQDGGTRNGRKWDACVYWDTPDEPLVGLQLADAVIAALNAGVYGLGYWTFMDFPDDYSPTYANKWGQFRWTGRDLGTRAPYYCYGLLTKFFRGPSAAVRVETDDPWLRAAAVRHPGGSWSVAVLNRYKEEVPVVVQVGQAVGKPFRRYLYDPAHIPFHPFGDLQPPSGTVAAADGVLRDRVGPSCLVVYTTRYDDQPPAAVRGVSVAATAEGHRITWQPADAPDLCYYRVYRGDRQIGSTVAAEYVDRGAEADPHYRVAAVDQSGNAGP